MYLTTTFKIFTHVKYRKFKLMSSTWVTSQPTKKETLCISYLNQISGVGYQPWIKEDPESTLIRFNPKDPNSYSQYTDVLDKYFEKYTNTNKTRVCTGTASNSDIIKDGKVIDANQEACRFNLDVFRRANCMRDSHYGFKSGQPCVVVSLNRLIGWKPESYGANEIPAEISKRYKTGSIAFNCGGMVSTSRISLPDWMFSMKLTEKSKEQ